MEKKLNYVILDEENKEQNFIFSTVYQIAYQFDQLTKEQREETLVVSGDRDRLELAIKEKMAVLGVEKEPSSIFLPCKLVIERLDFTTASELEKAFCREKEIPLIVMETKRMHVREVEVEDMDALYMIYKGEENTGFVEPLYIDRELEAEYLRDYIKSIYQFYDFGLWMLWDKETGEAIGRAGVEPMEYEGEFVLELGYIIAQEKRRKGYAREACEAILDHIKNLEEYPFVDAIIYSENIISIHFIQSLGFKMIFQEKKDKKIAQRWRKILHF